MFRFILSIFSTFTPSILLISHKKFINQRHLTDNHPAIFKFYLDNFFNENFIQEKIGSSNKIWGKLKKNRLIIRNNKKECLAKNCKKVKPIHLWKVKMLIKEMLYEKKLIDKKHLGPFYKYRCGYKKELYC